MKKEFTIAKKLALDAGKKIMEFYNKDYHVSEKVEDGYSSPLTEADLAANEIIIKGLSENFDYPILSEEEKDNQKRLQHSAIWVIDPLDGTKEFIKKNGEFTVNIALVFQGSPVIGIIYAPAIKKIYYAVKNKGAFTEENGVETKIEVSSINQIQDMRLIKSRSHASEKLNVIIQKNNITSVMESGSSIKGCLVAEGKADIYLRLGNQSEWDICAMDIIIKEAGGLMTSLRGKPLIYNKQNILVEGGYLVSNGKIHEKILSSI